MTHTTEPQRGADGAGRVLTAEQLEALLRCAGTTTLEYIGRIEDERRAAIAYAEAARSLYQASHPGMMIGEVLDALEAFREAIDRADAERRGDDR